MVALLVDEQMSFGWLIAVPAYGAWYRKLFTGPGLRSIRAAVIHMRKELAWPTMPVRFVVHTDHQVQIAQALPRAELTVLPPPADLPKYYTFAACHRYALQMARPQERVALFTADCVISEDAVLNAELRFRTGKRAIVCSGQLSLSRWTYPGVMKSRALLRWATRHAPPILEEINWGSGNCPLPWGVRFKQGRNVVLRAFHLHPFAVVNDRPLPFEGTTDIDLVANYKRDEIHVVTSADDLAIIEISPRGKTYGKGPPWKMDIDHVLAWAVRGAQAQHWWNFSHRICISGDPDKVTADHEVAAEILRHCPYPGALT
jgi:hypothetical protein